MPPPAALLVATDKHPQIKGTHKDGEVLVSSVSLHIENEVGASGAPSAERRYHALTLTKFVDCATPYLQEAHRDGNPFTTFRLRLYDTPQFGPSTNFLTIVLLGARIVRYKTVLPLSIGTIPVGHEYEEIRFTFQTISWTAKPAEGDSSIGGNTLQANDLDVRFFADGLDEKMRALTGDEAERVKKSEKEALWRQWRRAHPDFGGLPE